MESIILCNTGSDSLSVISLKDYKSKKIVFNLGEDPVGPHSLRVNDGKIITANNYSDSISIIDLVSCKEERNIKIGPKPNDLIYYDNKMFVVCGEGNNMVVYDFIEDKILMDIATGNWPHSIELLKESSLLFISNLESNSITVIDIKTNTEVKTIEAPEYPSKILVSKDKKYLFVCESYLGDDKPGYIDIIATSTLKRVKRVKVGTSPIDICEDEFKLYVSNLTNGSISVIDKKNFQLEENIYIGGMPKGIARNEDKIYVADYLKAKLYIIKEKKIIKIIAVESEPNAMILI